MPRRARFAHFRVWIRGAALSGGAVVVAGWASACGASSVEPVEVTIPTVETSVREPIAIAASNAPAAKDAEPPPLVLERWTEDVRQHARADNRPVLVVVCAWWIVACAHLERDVLGDVGVRAAAERYVTARLDLSGAAKVDDDARRAIGAEHIPAVLLVAPSGRTVERWRNEDLEPPRLAAALREFTP